MAGDHRSPDWFLKTEGCVQGPLSEAEMREAIRGSTSRDLLVRQGASSWHPADVIRKKLKALETSGIFIRFKQVAEGPFTLTKAYELLQTVSMDGIQVRVGVEGQWVPAHKWLRAIERAKAKKKRATLAAVAQLAASAVVKQGPTLASNVTGFVANRSETPAKLPEEKREIKAAVVEAAQAVVNHGMIEAVTCDDESNSSASSSIGVTEPPGNRKASREHDGAW